MEQAFLYGNLYASLPAPFHNTPWTQYETVCKKVLAEEFDGDELAVARAKTFTRMLRGTGAEQGSVALSLCTRSTNSAGASVSETTLRPNPRRRGRDPAAHRGARRAARAGGRRELGGGGGERARGGARQDAEDAGAGGGGS